ncbi:MAG: hypothetical protein U0175_14095 [Caldilineaceae bacterium]
MTTIDHSTSHVPVGEKVLLLLNHIKAEKRDDFEHFMQNILAPAVMRVAPDIYRRVRTLCSTQPESDGSYTYVFLIDPLMTETSYDIEEVLHKAYPSEEASAYLRIWNEAQAAPQTGYEVVQSNW